MLVAETDPSTRWVTAPARAETIVAARDHHPASAELQPLLKSSIKRVEQWVEDHDYKGYEPFDGLSSSLRPLTCGNLFLERLLLQLIRQSPVNLRPVLGVKPLDSTKGRGYMASGYLTMFKATGDVAYTEKAVSCLEWLMWHKSPRFQPFTWANHFDFASRGGRYSKDEPIVVWTALIGQAFLDAFECLDEQAVSRGCEERLRVDSCAAARAHDVRHVHQLSRAVPELDPQRQHAGGGDAGEDGANHRRLARSDRGSRGDGVQLFQPAAGRLVAVRRGAALSLDRQFPYCVQPGQPEVLHRQH